MPCGPSCACLEEPGLECLSVVDPPRFGFFREWCTSGDPVKRLHVRNRSRIGIIAESAPIPVAIEPHPVAIMATAIEESPGATPSRHIPDIPLAGDVVESIAHRIGADRLAAWWEKETGIPCGCQGRKELLNKASRKLLKWLGIEGNGA